MVLAPLGHERRHDAPIGTISGAIMPTTRSTVAPARAETPALDLAHMAVRPATADAPVDVPTLRWSELIPSRFSPAVRDENLRRTEVATSDAGVTPVQPAARTESRAAALPVAVEPPRRSELGDGPPPTIAAPIEPTRSALEPPPEPILALPAAPTRRLAGRPRSTAPARATTTSDESRRGLPLDHPPPPATTSVAVDTPIEGRTIEATSPAPARPTIGNDARARSIGTPPSASTAPVGGESPQPLAAERPATRPLAGQRTVHRRRLGEPLAHRPASMVAAPGRTVESTSSDAPLPVDRVLVARPPASRHALPVPHARRTTAMPIDEPHPDTPAIAPSHAERVTSSALTGRRRPLSRQRPRSADRPAGPTGAPLTVAVVQREQIDPPVVPITRPPTRPSARQSEADPSERAPEAVPADLRAQLEPMLGVDLSDVPVHRGPASSRAAAEMRARAFTIGEEVHLPEKLGPTSHGEARATLAHELTHVAQQRRLGAVAPNESSPAGEEMEAEARDVARRVDGPERVSITRPVQQQPVVPMVHSIPSGRVSATGRSSLSPAEAGAIATDIANAAMSSGLAHRPSNPAASHGGATHGAPSMGVSFGGATATTASAIGAQREPEPSSTPTPRPTTAPAMAPATAIESLSPERLDDLASRLYDGIRSRLRHDLLVQRERAGSLFDHR